MAFDVRQDNHPKSKAKQQTKRKNMAKYLIYRIYDHGEILVAESNSYDEAMHIAAKLTRETGYEHYVQ